jgi:hypothetical protein
LPNEFEVIAELANGGQRIRFLRGSLAGRTVIAFPDSHPYFRGLVDGERRRALNPDERAENLLRSLLTAEQLRDWVGRQRFLVSTRYGALEFGELYNIGFWPNSRGEFRLCVVPTRDEGRDLPVADQWINLLLALKANPERFFTVANWRRPGGQFMIGPVPGFERRT